MAVQLRSPMLHRKLRTVAAAAKLTSALSPVKPEPQSESFVNRQMWLRGMYQEARQEIACCRAERGPSTLTPIAILQVVVKCAKSALKRSRVVDHWCKQVEKARQHKREVDAASEASVANLAAAEEIISGLNLYGSGELDINKTRRDLQGILARHQEKGVTYDNMKQVCECLLTRLMQLEHAMQLGEGIAEALGKTIQEELGRMQLAIRMAKAAERIKTELAVASALASNSEMREELPPFPEALECPVVKVMSLDSCCSEDAASMPSTRAPSDASIFSPTTVTSQSSSRSLSPSGSFGIDTFAEGADSISHPSTPFTGDETCDPTFPEHSPRDAYVDEGVAISELADPMPRVQSSGGQYGADGLLVTDTQVGGGSEHLSALASESFLTDVHPAIFVPQCPSGAKPAEVKKSPLSQRPLKLVEHDDHRLDTLNHRRLLPPLQITVQESSKAIESSNCTSTPVLARGASPEEDDVSNSNLTSPTHCGAKLDAYEDMDSDISHLTSPRSIVRSPRSSVTSPPSTVTSPQTTIHTDGKSPLKSRRLSLPSEKDLASRGWLPVLACSTDSQSLSKWRPDSPQSPGGWPQSRKLRPVPKPLQLPSVSHLSPKQTVAGAALKMDRGRRSSI